MKKYAAWFLCASVAALPVSSFAHAPKTVAPPAPPPFTDSDTTFAESATEVNTFEIEISQLATAQAKRQKVKDLAADLVKQHTDNQNKLSALALQHGLELNKDMSTDEQQIIDRLKTEKGHRFDRDYLDIQAQAHSDALAMFQNEAESASDPDLKSYASATADATQAHLNDALKLGAKKPTATH